MTGDVIPLAEYLIARDALRTVPDTDREPAAPVPLRPPLPQRQPPDLQLRVVWPDIIA